MSEEETIMSMNDQKIEIEPPEYSEEDYEHESDENLDDKTCLERFMNSEITIEEEVKHEVIQTPGDDEKPSECTICNKTFIRNYLLNRHVCDDTIEKSLNLSVDIELDNCPHKCGVCIQNIDCYEISFTYSYRRASL